MRARGHASRTPAFRTGMVDSVAPASNDSDDRSREFVDALAEVYSLEGDARVLLARVKFLAGSQPKFDKPEVFWSQVVWMADRGAIKGGSQSIAQAALAQYPYNEVFLRHSGLDRDPHANNLVSRDELARYRAKARSLHRVIDLVGFDDHMRVEVALTAMYVPLDVVLDRSVRGRDIYSSPHHARLATPRTAHLRRGPIPLPQALRLAWSNDIRGVILLGDPGSGKTACLQHLLLELIERGTKTLGLPEGTIPVLLPLRNLHDRNGGLPSFIQQELHSPVLDVKDDFGHRLCQRGKMLYLLDGLDEVVDPTGRARVARWIERAQRHAPDSYFVVSSRYAGYSGPVELGPGFLELHVQPLDDPKVEVFIHKWFTIVQQPSTLDGTAPDSTDDGRKAEAQRRAAELVGVLSRSRPTSDARLGELKRNPLFLTAICLAHCEPDHGRATHVGVYDRIVAALIGRSRVRGTTSPTPSDAVAVAQSLAWWMHERVGPSHANRTELYEPLEQTTTRLASVTMETDELLRSLRDEIGLLTGWGPDEYGFIHLGLQEHLAARHGAALASTHPETLRVLATRFEDPRWQEVILSMLALRASGTSDAFMRAVLEQPESTRWLDPVVA